jgi:hypothetical protein
MTMILANESSISGLVTATPACYTQKYQTAAEADK